MNVGVISLGCAKNQVDTEEMLSFLKKDGFQFVHDANEAQVLVVNTCGFIASAKVESLDAIYEMAAYKKTGICWVLCVTGCLAQRYEQELLKMIPEIDVLIGVSQYPQLGGFIQDALAGRRAVNTQRGADFSGCGRVLTTPPYTAYIRIAEGCDNCCAYCAIPLIRGGFRSRPMDQILEEMRTLAAGGAREQILIAQDTSRYGSDLQGETLAGLLEKAARIPGVDWLRVLYCYPDEISRELIDTMAKHENICRYLDLPLQHAVPRILKKMNRRGDIREIEALLLYARQSGFALRTTMIVGFPGETEEDFGALMDFCARVRFDHLGAFAYSPEEDTKAYRMRGKVPEEEKDRRLDMLMAMQRKISLRRNRERVGQVLEVLITGHKGKAAIGRSRWEAPDSDGVILVKSSRFLREGEMVYARVLKAHAYDLEVEWVDTGTAP